MITLVIKGDINAALNAAHLRRIELTALISSRHETRATAPMHAMPDIARWFCEAGDAPYPAGTLLFYATK